MTFSNGPSLKTLVTSACPGGDILFVVPPFVTVKTPILGPHILQTISRHHGFTAHVLYLNLALASIIGPEHHETISYGQPFRLLGERLFARSAHGLPALGRSPELCLDPPGSVFGKHGLSHMEAFEYKYLNASDFDLSRFSGVENACFDFMEEVISALSSLTFGMVGCSTNWEQNNASIALLNGLKHNRPEIITLVGGSNCEGEMAQGIASLSDSIDYIFSGEGETVFDRFLDDFGAGRLPGERILIGKAKRDLNSQELPDYGDYTHQRGLFLSETASEDWSVGYETSRGCWWGKCYFCGLNGVDRQTFRKKDAAKTLRELSDIHRTYPGKPVIMADKVMPRSYKKDLLPFLDKEKGTLPDLCYEQRPNLTLTDMIHLDNAGVITIKPGIESLSDGLLALMNKGVRARHNLQLLRFAASLGMYVDWNMLWGFPGDQLVHYEQTLAVLPLIHHLCPPAVFRHICIDRFSPYFDRPEQFGIKNLRPWAVYAMPYPDRAESRKLAYRFIGDYSSGAHENIHVIKNIAEELSAWKENWQKVRLILAPLGGDMLMIYDNRPFNGKTVTHAVSAKQARNIMTCCPFSESKHQTWAVEQKLGVVTGEWYVPLVTASADLLMMFEKEENGHVRKPVAS